MKPVLQPNPGYDDLAEAVRRHYWRRTNDVR